MTIAAAAKPGVESSLAKAYDPRLVETGVYDRWDDAGYFQPRERPDREPFVVVMPPPNVTGELHIGHALFVTVEDIMIRWHRMLGDPTLWIPGADHAGIAGQWVVEKELAKEGLTRHDLGREKFLQRVWQFMNQYRGRIREQMMILGASCDWTRFVFTMDPGPSRAVRHVFKRLYDKGLIYRGERLISWCPRCQTALSDLEVVHRDEAGSLWTIAYPIEGSDEVITVATTRPETMLGDTGVAVHPDDDRYRHLVGKQARLPILDRLIPIVADDAVDPAFGTGAVKVTPGHDPNDFEIGKRQGLPAINVMNTDGTMNADAGPFAGMPIAAARSAVVERLREDGRLMRTEPHVHAVGHCQRCDTVVEPLISTQWFVRMEELARPAIARGHGTAACSSCRSTSDRVYLNWLENIHDWTVSRQLWWGHRIPVWYCQRCGETIVTEEETLAACPHCGGPVEQDPDVLDTWFSSGLWPFSTLGWPDDTPDLRRYYPSSVMETGYEILFFWVARMVMFGLEVMGELPFHTVYLHGTVRDVEGAKMSKTKGNVIDPTAVTAEYGADALRFALVTQSAPGERPAPRHPEGRGRPQLRQQALERDPLRAAADRRGRDRHGRRRPRSPQRRARPGRPLDPQPPRRHHRGRQPLDANAPVRRGRKDDSRVRLVRAVRLVHRSGQGAAAWLRRGAAGCRADARLRHGALRPPPAPVHAVRHRGALAGAAARRARA